MNVVNYFLHGELKEEAYVEQHQILNWKSWYHHFQDVQSYINKHQENC